MSQSATSAYLLNTSRDGDSITSVGSLIILSVKRFFPSIQSELPLMQLCPIACYVGEETNLHLTTTSSQVTVESSKVSPEPPFLQAVWGIFYSAQMQWEVKKSQTVPVLSVEAVARAPKEGLSPCFGKMLCSLH